MKKMNWKDYEKEIYEYFSETFPNTRIQYNQFVIGKYSKVKRQIDILIEGSIAGFNLKIIIDCKYFSKKIDVKAVESFSSMVEDCDAHQGVLITSMGYSQAAINRAHYGTQKLELDILNFDEIKSFQGLVAIPYREHDSVLILAPFGWVIDNRTSEHTNATLYQRGLTIEKAKANNEWMYLNFWKTDIHNFSIDDLIEFQNFKLIDGDPNAEFEYQQDILRKDKYPTKIRIAKIKTYPSLEVTGFIKFDNYIFFIVLFTPEELLNKNLRKLQFLLSHSKPATIEFNNTKIIDQFLMEIDKIDSSDLEKKTEMHHKLGGWYMEMRDYPNSLMHFRKAIGFLPNHYRFLKQIIPNELNYGTEENCLKYCSQLFEIEPKNPTVPQNLIEIFFDLKREDFLEQFFMDKIEQHTENEILGNLHFHLAILKFNLDKKEASLIDFKFAKNYFIQVFPKGHEVFKTLKQFVKD